MIFSDEVYKLIDHEDNVQYSIKDKICEVSYKELEPSSNNINLGSYIDTKGLKRFSRLKYEADYFIQLNNTVNEPEYESYYDAFHEEYYQLQYSMMYPISFVSISNKDVIYWNQFMHYPYAEKFNKSEIK